MRFLNNLDELLHKNKMTRTDLARAINIAPSTVNSWFARSSDGVSLKTLVAISKYFNISLDDLVNGDLAAPANTDNLSKEEVAQLKRLLAYAENLGGGKK